jgi:hypothetical protein
MPVLNVPEITIVSGSTSPWSVPALWDSITIAGQTYGWASGDGIGGKVVIRRAKRHYKVDVKFPSGAAGAVITYRGGPEPKAFDLLFHFWTGAQFDLLNEEIIPLLQPSGTAGKPPNPLVVTTPVLNSIGIASIFSTVIGTPEPTDPDKPDRYIWPVEVYEYVPPPVANVTVTPAGTQPYPPGLGNDFVGPPPQTALQKKEQVLANLRDQAVAGRLPVPF